MTKKGEVLSLTQTLEKAEKKGDILTLQEILRNGIEEGETSPPDPILKWKRDLYKKCLKIIEKKLPKKS